MAGPMVFHYLRILDFTEGENGEIELITSSEFQTIHLSLNLEDRAERFFQRWEDGILIGGLPEILSVHENFDYCDLCTTDDSQ